MKIKTLLALLIYSTTTFVYSQSPQPFEWSKVYERDPVTYPGTSKIKRHSSGNGFYGSLSDGGGITRYADDGAFITASASANYHTDLTSSQIEETNDGGYIIALTDSINSTIDTRLIKYDSSFTIEWTQSYGGSGLDYPLDVKQTADGGYVFVGETNSDDGDLTGIKTHGTAKHYWIVKTDDTGTVEWMKTYGGTTTPTGFMRYAEATNVIQDNAGNYIVSGSMSATDGDVVGNHGHNDIWVLKLDSTGTILWQESLGGSGNDESSGDMILATDGNYVLSGSSKSVDGDIIVPAGSNINLWVVKLDAATGTILWETSIGGNSNYGDTVPANSSSNIQHNIAEYPDGDLLVIGRTSADDLPGYHTGFADVLLSKLDKTNGSVIWQNCYGGSGSDMGFTAFVNDDGSITASVSSSSTDGDLDPSITTGNTGSSRQWWFKLEACPEFTYEPDIILCEGESYNFYGTNITQAGSYNHTITGGATNGCDQVVMLNVEIDLLEQPVIIENNSTLSTEEAYAAYQWLKDGQPIDGANQATYTPTESGDYQVEVTNENGCSKISDGFLGINQPLLFSDIKLYPNPVNDVVHIEIPQLNDKASLSLISITGKVISTQTILGSHTQIPVNGLAKGVYFVKISTNNATVVKKVIKK